MKHIWNMYETGATNWGMKQGLAQNVWNGYESVLQPIRSHTPELPEAPPENDFEPLNFI